MNQSSVSRQDELTSVEREALHWIERTEAPDFTDEEGDAFRAWFAASEDNRAAYESFLSMIGAVRAAHETAAPALGLEASSSDARLDAGASFPWSLISGMAAVLMLCAGIGLWAVLSGGPEGIRYATAVGEQRVVTLDDGSAVTLNTGSEIRVFYSERRRRVDLVKGQAAFDVASDPARPFQAYTDDGMIMALGTIFDVRRRESETVFTLVEGSALVGDREAADGWRRWRARADDGRLPRDVVKLAPGEQVRALQVETLSEAALSDVTAANVDDAMAWREGRVVFKNAALAEAIEEMNRYSKTTLTLAEGDAALRARAISGRFNTDPEAFAENLEFIFPDLETVAAGEAEIRIERRDAAL